MKMHNIQLTDDELALIQDALEYKITDYQAVDEHEQVEDHAELFHKLDNLWD